MGLEDRREDVSLNVVLRQAAEEEVDGGKVCAVESLIVSGTTGEYPGLEDKPDLELQSNTTTFPETSQDSPLK